MTATPPAQRRSWNPYVKVRRALSERRGLRSAWKPLDAHLGSTPHLGPAPVPP